MRVILAKVEETIDAAIDGSRQFVWNDVPLIIAVEIEEVALVVCVSLCLIELSVLSDVLLHVAVRIDAIVPLQFRGKTR